MGWPTLPPQVRETLTASAGVLAAVAVTFWRVLRPVLVLIGQVLLALVVIFEEWGWEPLAALVARLARFRPWAMLEVWIAGLPPYGALCVFALPAVLLFPFKLVALWLFAHGHVVMAAGTFIMAKITGTAFLARIFLLTKPALMQIGWFARAYARFVPWKESAEVWLRESWAWRVGRVVKHRAKRVAHGWWNEAKPRLAQWAEPVRLAWARLGPQLRVAGVRLLREGRTRLADLLKRLLGERSL